MHSNSFSGENVKENLGKQVLTAAYNKLAKLDRAMSKSFKHFDFGKEKNLKKSGSFGKQVVTSSYQPGKLDRTMSKSFKHCEFSEEKNLKKLESFGNGIKTFALSDSIGENSKKKIESAVHTNSTHSSNEKAANSSDTYNDNLNLTDKLEQSPESLVLDVITTHKLESSDEIKEPTSTEIIKVFGTQNEAQEHCNEFSIESSKNGSDQTQKLQSFQRSMSLESTVLSSETQSKVAEQLVKLCYSDIDEQVRILQEVDELKVELQRLLTKTASGNESSAFSIKVTHFKGKLPSEKDRSSLTPLSGEPINSTYETCRTYPEKHILLPKHEKPLTVKRHSRPFLGGAPFVICCKCYKLLQLPADFLVSTKRIHKLRCGACSEVLKYTFRSRTRSALQTSALKYRTCDDEDTSVNGDN